jgi:two-component system phosphate regulon sensor histidine kinase PhoR
VRLGLGTLGSVPARPDYARFIAGHADVIERINAGEAGLPILDIVLRLAQDALGAVGMTFAEYGPSGGRVVAATGAAEWALGRPVDTESPTSLRTLTGLRTQVLTLDEIDGTFPHQATGRGLHTMLSTRVTLGGLVVGTLHAFYPSVEDLPTIEHHTLIEFVAVNLAHMYGHQAGLPVHGDGPVVAALSDGLAIIDYDRKVRLWNPAAEEVTGLSAADVLNATLPFPIPVLGQTLDHRLADGRWLKITASELTGTVDSVVVTFRDVTDQHRRDGDRDLFVALTSHELRTPVTVIKGYADTLNSHWDELPEYERRHATDVIGQRAGELARLVDRLLSAADQTGPAAGSPPTPFDLVEALRVAERDLPTALRRRLVVRLPVDLPKAVGDRSTITTILTELVTNADKYSPDGSPIELTAHGDERTVVFRVSDRGIGVRPEHVERAFDRFWQAESGDRRRYPGAGLGLYLVRRVIERQNGWVSLRPRDGGGTVAEVRLPRG